MEGCLPKRCCSCCLEHSRSRFSSQSSHSVLHTWRCKSKSDTSVVRHRANNAHQPQVDLSRHGKPTPLHAARATRKQLCPALTSWVSSWRRVKGRAERPAERPATLDSRALQGVPGSKAELGLPPQHPGHAPPASGFREWHPVSAPAKRVPSPMGT